MKEGFGNAARYLGDLSLKSIGVDSLSPSGQTDPEIRRPLRVAIWQAILQFT